MAEGIEAATGRLRPAIFSWLPHYRRSWLRNDLIGGLTVMALLVPEGMAYAELAGMPPVTALYAAPVGLTLYAILGSSRQLVVASSAAVATLSFAVVSPLAPVGTAEFAALTAGLALLAGLIALLGGLLRLGRLADFFSDSVLTGFVAGLSLTIVLKQLPKLLGIEAGHGNFWQQLSELFAHLPGLHLPTVLLGGLCLALLFALERFFHRIPAALVVLFVGIALVRLFDLGAAGVHVVGAIQAGFVSPSMPAITRDDVLQLLPGAAAIALLSFAEAMGPVRGFAARHNYDIDPNRELLGLGAANLGAGLFRTFPIGSSISKSSGNDLAGAHTQLSGLIAAAATVVVVLFLTPLFRNLPEAALAAIVVVEALRLVNLAKLRHLLRVRRSDFALAFVALIGALSFSALAAVLIAVIISLLALIWNAGTPDLVVLGRTPGRMIFVDVRHQPEAETVPGLLVARPNTGLFFANAGALHDAVIRQIEQTSPPVKRMVLDLSATADLDAPSVEMFAELAGDLRGREVRFVLAELSPAAQATLARAGALATIGPENLAARTFDAVLDYLISEHDVADFQLLLQNGLAAIRDLLAARGADATSERSEKLAAIVADLDDSLRLLSN
jgi:SulP family sulfate permease